MLFVTSEIPFRPLKSLAILMSWLQNGENVTKGAMVPTMQHTEENRYHKAIYAAKALKVSRITIYRYITEGKIEAVRIGRNYYISDRAFFRYLCEHRMPPGFQDGLRNILLRLRESLAQPDHSE